MQTYLNYKLVKYKAWTLIGELYSYFFFVVPFHLSFTFQTHLNFYLHNFISFNLKSSFKDRYFPLIFILCVIMLWNWYQIVWKIEIKSIVPSSWRSSLLCHAFKTTTFPSPFPNSNKLFVCQNVKLQSSCLFSLFQDGMRITGTRPIYKVKTFPVQRKRCERQLRDI